MYQTQPMSTSFNYFKPIIYSCGLYDVGVYHFCYGNVEVSVDDLDAYKCCDYGFRMYICLGYLGCGLVCLFIVHEELFIDMLLKFLRFLMLNLCSKDLVYLSSNVLSFVDFRDFFTFSSRCFPVFGLCF